MSLIFSLFLVPLLWFSLTGHKNILKALSYRFICNLCPLNRFFFYELLISQSEWILPQSPGLVVGWPSGVTALISTLPTPETPRHSWWKGLPSARPGDPPQHSRSHSRPPSPLPLHSTSHESPRRKMRKTGQNARPVSFWKTQKTTKTSQEFGKSGMEETWRNLQFILWFTLYHEARFVFSH